MRTTHSRRSFATSSSTPRAASPISAPASRRPARRPSASSPSARTSSSRSARWPVRVAQRTGATLGFVVVDEVIGKFELITYAVGIGLDGAVKQVEVLSYRESHGHEIRLPAWRRQFVGKTAASPLRIGEDIAYISGATLSCSHVTEGVRRIVA